MYWNVTLLCHQGCWELPELAMAVLAIWVGSKKKRNLKAFEISKSVGGLEHFFRGVGWNHQPVFQNDSTRVPDPQTFEPLRRPQNVQVGMRGRKAPGSGHQGRFDLEIRLEDGSWILSSQAPILWCFMG